MTELLEAGVHFGHQIKRWNPKMKPYIFEKRNAIYLIDLAQTAAQLDAASRFLQNTAAKGGKVLFVGCKKQAQDAIKEAAQATGHFWVNQRWLGGTLTNLKAIRKSVHRMEYLESLESQPEFSKMGKQGIAAAKREGEKLKRNLEGIRTMDKLPDAVVIIDTVREAIAVAECKRLRIPTIAIVDTKTEPEAITYPIAGNDDAIRSIRIVLQKLVDAIIAGQGRSWSSRGEGDDGWEIASYSTHGTPKPDAAVPAEGAAHLRGTILDALKTHEGPLSIDQIATAIGTEMTSGYAQAIRAQIARLVGELKALSPTTAPNVILGELHDEATGRINAQKVADFMGVPLKQLSEGLGLNYKAVHRSPAAAGFQQALRPVKRSLEILHEFFGPKETIRIWLNTPHPDLDGVSALETILEGKAFAVSRILGNAWNGVPV